MSALRQAMVGKSRPTTATEGPALWRGEVVEVLANGLVWVMVPRMGGQDPIGPINSIPTGLVAGDRVVVGSIGGGVNDLIVMSLTVARPTPPAPHRHTYADIDGVIPTSALPPLAVIDTFTADSQAQMLTLTAQRGDMCIRTDTFLTFVLAADDPSKLVNWKTITAAGQVTSVNGRTGTVQLSTDDVNGLTTALSGKANVMHTHDITAIIGGLSNWTELPITSPRFEKYSVSTQPRIKKEFGRVHFAGALRALAGGLLNSATAFVDIPAAYAPSSSEQPVFVCQGSGSDRWSLDTSGGLARASRYGPGAQGTGAWLPFSVSWDAATPQAV